MNQQQKNLTVLAATTVAFGASIVTSKILDLRLERRRAENARKRTEANTKFMESLDTLRAGLDRQLETARFWEQVTHDM